MKLTLISKLRSWLRNDSGIDQAFSEVELFASRVEEQNRSIKSLKAEGTLTVARLECMVFRATKALNQYEEQTKIPLVRYTRVSILLFFLQVLSLAALWYVGAKTSFVILMFSISVLPYIIPNTIYKNLLCMSSQESAATSRRMKTAEFLLWLLLPHEGREAAIGDTNETFEMIVERFGLGKARFWYWSEVAKSAWPLLCYLGKRTGKWCGIGALAEFLRRAL